MATLRSPELKSEFRLDVDGYQLLKPVGDDWDDNWLILKMAVATPERRWNARGSYLTTFELNNLADSLKTWADDAKGDKLSFTAQNLAFTRGAGGKDLVDFRVGFDLDCHPEAPGKAGNPLWVKFAVTPAELREFAGALQKEAEPYPERHLTGTKKLFTKVLKKKV
ncbi:MAG TPA: hypothetical protein VFS19_02375 [Planctomycetota bacterium]|nr:hypothetical protein [Planctomycetota bacterium]